MNISDVQNQCSACHACISICPQNCISLIQNEYGMIEALVDESKCINCNLCAKVCPKLEIVEKESPILCLAAYRKDMSKSMNCASGGIAYSLYDKYVSEDCYVVGVRFDQNNKAIFDITNRKEEISVFQGSKYVQADMSGVYDEIKEILKEGKKILIIALPCQIAAIKNFINCKRLPMDNVIFVDCLCHGVSPQRYLDEELNYLSEKYKWGKINKITFRSNYKYRDYNLTIFAENRKGKKNIYCSPSDADYYFYAFLNGISLCECCYNCDYAQINRVSDITIGDYIRIGSDSRYPKYEGKRNNVSIILCNTQKGVEVFSIIKNELEYFKRPLEEAFNQCPALRAPSTKTEKRKKFLDKYIRRGFNYAVKSTSEEISHDIIKKKLKQTLKQYYFSNSSFKRLIDIIQERSEKVKKEIYD